MKPSPSQRSPSVTRIDSGKSLVCYSSWLESAANADCGKSAVYHSQWLQCATGSGSSNSISRFYHLYPEQIQVSIQLLASVTKTDSDE